MPKDKTQTERESGRTRGGSKREGEGGGRRERDGKKEGKRKVRTSSGRER